MPNLGNITIKKADGTTDVLFTGISPSAGDKTPAIFRSNSVGSNVLARPELRVTTQNNGTNTARRVKIDFSYPQVTDNMVQGTRTVAGRANFSLTGIVPVAMDDEIVAEACTQVINLLASPLIRDVVLSGYAPT